jgi:hypothetical protein
MSNDEAAAAPVVDDADAAPAGEEEVVQPGLGPMLARLADIAEDKRSHNCRQLVKCTELQHQLLDLIADPDAFAESNPGVDPHIKASALFLESYYHGITGMHHVVSLDMLEPEAVDSGLCAELILPHEQG